jgi:ribonuclease P protein component
MAHQFKKAEKLCNQSQIDLLFCEGKTLSQFPFRLIWLQKNNKELPLQTLISVPKKRIAKAYERNRVKRLIREAFRKNKFVIEDSLKLKNQSIDLAILYTENKVLEYNDLEDKICLTLQRLSLEL